MRRACAGVGWDDACVVNAVLRSAPAIALKRSVVAGCRDLGRRPDDQRFERAWNDWLAALARGERFALSGLTGHVAESVVEVLLVDVGWHPLRHFTGSRRHGVDLLTLSPAADHVLAIEVKGTLRAGVLPRLSRRALLQMSAAWMDKRDNPGMAQWDLQSADVFGAVVSWTST